MAFSMLCSTVTSIAPVLGLSDLLSVRPLFDAGLEGKLSFDLWLDSLLVAVPRHSSPLKSFYKEIRWIIAVFSSFCKHSEGFVTS